MTSEPALEPATPARPGRLRRALRPLALAVAVGFLAWAVYRQRDGFAEALARLAPGTILAALLAVLAALVLNMLSWRSAMAAVGAHLPLIAAARVFFLSQLGKYVPGSVWPVVAQMELTKESGVPRARGALGAVISMAIGVVTSTTVAAALLILPRPDVRDRYGWMVATVALGSIALVPAVLRRLLGVVVRLTRRGPVDTSVHGPALVRSGAWSLGMWALLGVQTWLIAQDLGGDNAPGLLISTGAYALAWAAGFLFVITPAGLGVREAALTLALSGYLPTSDALALALVSRVVMTVGDGLAAGVAALLRPRESPGRPAHPEGPAPDPADGGA